MLKYLDFQNILKVAMLSKAMYKVVDINHAEFGNAKQDKSFHFCLIILEQKHYGPLNGQNQQKIENPSQNKHVPEKLFSQIFNIPKNIYLLSEAGKFQTYLDRLNSVALKKFPNEIKFGN